MVSCSSVIAGAASSSTSYLPERRCLRRLGEQLGRFRAKS
jgi:hypothetical protein